MSLAVFARIVPHGVDAGAKRLFPRPSSPVP